MSHIRILPIHLRNKIAAGEVIERPASVVKELLENALDAEADAIAVDILSGGKVLIRVSDNGTGMDQDDALRAFERHATSKLIQEEDLFNIQTLGFRGEALSSIASVSKVTLTTCPRNASSGIQLEIYGGTMGQVKDAPSLGTSVEVRDLFYNTPARKNFLKTDRTELYHIIDAVTRASLSHWDIQFRLTVDSEEIMNLPRASGQRERTLQVYGQDFLNELMEVSTAMKGLTLYSLTTRVEHFRGTKSHQFIFVNKRPIRDRSLVHAVYRAYEGILPREKHPVFFLFLTIPPWEADINVHPTKREIRFRDKESVYRTVFTAFRDAVKKCRSAYVKDFIETGSDGDSADASSFPTATCPNDISTDKAVSENLEFSYTPYISSLYLGDTFFALTIKGGLMLVDHHAAHERVIYERLLKGLHLHVHQLLFPRHVKLSRKEYELILDHRQMLKDFGIEIDDFGHESVIVRSLPDGMEEADIRGILADIAACIMEGVPPEKSLREMLAARIACHQSLRGKHILNQEKTAHLLQALEQTDSPDQCPHGRPTRIFISLDDLKKMFKRK